MLLPSWAPPRPIHCTEERAEESGRERQRERGGRRGVCCPAGCSQSVWATRWLLCLGLLCDRRRVRLRAVERSQARQTGGVSAATAASQRMRGEGPSTRRVESNGRGDERRAWSGWGSGWGYGTVDRVGQQRYVCMCGAAYATIGSRSDWSDAHSARRSSGMSRLPHRYHNSLLTPHASLLTPHCCRRSPHVPTGLLSTADALQHNDHPNHTS